MKKSLRNLARLIVQELHDKSPKEVDRAMAEVLSFMSERRLISRWRDLEKEIHYVWKEKFGVSKVTILSAHPLMKKTYELIEEMAPGAEIVERVDARLMGGAVIRMDERRIDGSIIGALQRLKNDLTKI